LVIGTLLEVKTTPCDTGFGPGLFAPLAPSSARQSLPPVMAASKHPISPRPTVNHFQQQVLIPVRLINLSFLEYREVA
jgi:hypothetical protein